MLDLYLAGVVLCATVTIWRTTVNSDLAAQPLAVKALGIVAVTLLWPVTLGAVLVLMWGEYRQRDDA